MTKLRLLVVISAERTSRSLGEGSSLNEIESSNQTAPPAANSVPGQTDSIDATDQRASQTAPSAANNVPGRTGSTDVTDQSVSDDAHSKINN